jgi:hypothetical protein
MTMEGPSLVWMGRSLDWLTSTLKILLYLLVSWINAWICGVSLGTTFPLVLLKLMHLCFFCACYLS